MSSDFSFLGVAGLGAGRTSSLIPPTLAPAMIALDAPVTSAMVAAGKGRYAFGFDRMVEGYAGNTVRLKELSGGTVSDFGVDSAGRFDLPSVLAWAGSADLDVVQFFDQMGGALLLTGVGTVAFRRSGAIGRFGTTFDPSTSQLTRSAANGGVGVNLGGVGHFVLTGTTINLAAASLGIHLLFSNNNRKIATTDTTDPFAGSTTAEYILSYGNNSNAQFRCQMAGAAASGTSRFVTSSTDLTSANFVPFPNSGRWKKYAQNVLSVSISGTGVSGYGYGRRFYNLAATTNQQTAVAGGTLNNGTLVIGATFSSSSSNAQSTSSRMDGLFGGVILTSGLTDLERTLMHCKMNLVGQQHLATTATDLLGYYDEWIVAKDVDGAGVIAGRKGQMNLIFNKGDASTDWDFAYQIANVGLQGIRSPTFTAPNRFYANNNFFSGVRTGSILSIHYNEQTGAELHYTWAREDQSYTATGLTTRGNLAMGFDHNASGVITRWAYSKDTENLFIGRYKVDATAGSGFTAWGSAIYEAGGAGANQSMGKYNVNTTHNFFNYNETMTDGGTYTLTKTWWETGADVAGGAPPYALDAPVVAPVPGNTPPAFRQDCVLIHLANFQEPAGYDPNASYATRKAQRLTGRVDSYITPLATPLNHVDGGYARNANAGVADGGTTDKIQSMTFSGSGFRGTRLAMAWKAGTLTEDQLARVAANAYKLVA